MLQKTANLLALMFSSGVNAIECADMKLVDDLIVEGRPAKPGIAPGKTGRRSHNTIAIWIRRIDAKLASAGITF